MTDTELLEKLADIELPAPPAWTAFLLSAVLVVAVIVTTLWITRKRRGSACRALATVAVSHRREARGMLDRLQAEWAEGVLDEREAAYRLATLLRLGLELPQLTLTCPPFLAADKTQWRRVIELLNRLRYTKSPSVRLSPEIFQGIAGWLDAGPPQERLTGACTPQPAIQAESVTADQSC